MLNIEYGNSHSTHVKIHVLVIWTNLVAHMAKTLKSHAHRSLYHRWDHRQNDISWHPIFIYQPWEMHQYFQSLCNHVPYLVKNCPPNCPLQNQCNMYHENQMIEKNIGYQICTFIWRWEGGFLNITVNNAFLIPLIFNYSSPRASSISSRISK